MIVLDTNLLLRYLLNSGSSKAWISPMRCIWPSPNRPQP